MCAGKGCVKEEFGVEGAKGRGVVAGEEERTEEDSGGVMLSVTSVFDFPKGKAAKTFFALEEMGVGMENFNEEDEEEAVSVGREGVIGAGVGEGLGGTDETSRGVEEEGGRVGAGCWGVEEEEGVRPRGVDEEGGLSRGVAEGRGGIRGVEGGRSRGVDAEGAEEDAGTEVEEGGRSRGVDTAGVEEEGGREEE